MVMGKVSSKIYITQKGVLSDDGDSQFCFVIIICRPNRPYGKCSLENNITQKGVLSKDP